MGSMRSKRIVKIIEKYFIRVQIKSFIQNYLITIIHIIWNMHRLVR